MQGVCVLVLNPMSSPLLPLSQLAESGGAFSSFGGSIANMFSTGEDLSWAKDAEPVIDSHLGEGSAAFRCGVRV